MNDTDRKAFEEWAISNFSVDGCEVIGIISPHFETCYLAAIAYERKRSEKLVEALKEILFCVNDQRWNDIEFECEKALAEYKKEG